MQQSEHEETRTIE